MATESRAPGTDLSKRDLPDVLLEEPYRVAFFQAVRLLHWAYPEAARIGSFGDPRREVVRFRAHPSLSFPASEIQSLEFAPGRPPTMTVNFMGLTGPLGVLPPHYTELVRERSRARDTALRDFLDIFHHRLISLFYLAWEKYRPPVTFEHRNDDPFRERLFCLLGLGTPGLRGRMGFPDESLLFQGGLLLMHSRPVAAVEDVLRGYFEVPVEVEQFVGAWRPIEASALCDLGKERYSEQLGFGAVVGDEVWDAQSGFRIKLGPMPLDEYKKFLPGGTAYAQLKAWVKYFAGLEFSVEVQLILRKEDVPDCELADPERGGPQLGWTTWMKSKPFQRNPSDLLLELN